jgi:hypothetical protein
VQALAAAGLKHVGVAHRIKAWEHRAKLPTEIRHGLAAIKVQAL